MKITTLTLLLALSAATTFAQTSPTENPMGGRRGMRNRPVPANPEAAAEPSANPTPADNKPDPSLIAADKISTTHAQITIDGKPFPYTTTTGYLPLKDETGKPRANIFFVAYTKDEPQPSQPATTQPSTEATTDPANQPLQRSAFTVHRSSRPITFVFNGGPGAAAIWLHLGTVGPYRVETPDTADIPTPPGKLVENPATWLTDTDLVFIDPVGTGYSRAATPDQAREFYGVNEDIAAVADFIRLYTTKYQRWESPKFLAGESYGTTRAAALAEHLFDQQGIALNGIILISTVLDFATLNPQEGNDLPYALFLPTYTATAFYHQKLSPDLQKDLPATIADVENFTLNTYIPALAKGSLLPAADRTALIDQLAHYTGLSKDYITKADLRIDPSRFEKELLNDDANPRILGRMDTRITAYTNDANSSRPDFDPALSGYLPLYTAAFNNYVRQNLKYENDLPYEALSNHVGPWNFGTNGQGFLYVADNLRNAMQKNPHLKVLVASGYFDLATPFFTTDYTLAHLNLPAPLRPNLTRTYYPGGHMMYHEKSSREKLHTDISHFLQSAATP